MTIVQALPIATVSAAMLLAQVADVGVATQPASLAAAVERLGAAGIVVFFLAWMIKYFMGLLQTKEQRLREKDDEIKGITDRFLASTEKMSIVVQSNTDELRETRRSSETMANALTELKGALRRESRS
jgi:hypothetical protein